MPHTGAATPAPRQPLTRARIVDAALAIADAEGIEAVGMRGVARSLSVDPMSLYNHVENKPALLDGIVNALVAQADLPGALRWDDWARTAARHFRDVADRHPRAFPVFAGHGGRTVEVAAAFEPFVAALVEAGLPIEDCAVVLNAFMGTLLDTAGAYSAAPLTDPMSDAEAQRRGEEVRALSPLLRAMIDAHPIHQADESFDVAVELLIDGLRTRLHRGRRGPAGTS